jgi:hypothetical protein
MAITERHNGGIRGAGATADAVVGFLRSTSAAASTQAFAFHQGLKDAGFLEARTSRSSTAMRTTTSIGCRLWSPSGCAARRP